MKKNLKYLAVILVGLMLGCASRNTVDSIENQQAFQNLKQLVDSKQFTILSNRANPSASNSLNQLSNSGILGVGNNASSIDLTTNANFLKVKGDSVFGFLPFFGERHFGSDLGTNHMGIEFKGVPDDYEVVYDDSKMKVEIAFDIKDQYKKQESYTVYVSLFKNYRTDIRINSSNRSSISYSGNVKALEKDKEPQ